MAPLRSTLLALLCAIWAPIASSQSDLTRLGEFKINTTTDGEQRRPSVASDFNGNFIVVWTTVDDGSGSGVYAQKYLQDGTPFNQEFQVNTTGNGDQDEPSVGKDGDGNFVVVWQSDGQDADGGHGIYAQRYLNDASPVDGEFLVNSPSSVGADQKFPSIAMNKSGTFVIAWTSYGQNGQPSIYFQRYSSDGTPQGAETLAAPADVTRQEPSVAINETGDFVIVWRQAAFDGTRDVYGRGFNADGTPKQGSPFEVKGLGDANVHDYASVALAEDGTFVVTWQANGTSGDNNGFGLRGQRFNANAVKVGPEITVNSIQTGDQVDASVTIDPTGGFAVAWTSATGDGSGSAVFARLFAADGTPRDVEFLASTYPSGDQRTNPVEGALAFDSSGNFVIVWDSPAIESTSPGIVADKFYRANQGPSTVEFRVNATTPGDQTLPAVASAPDGRAVVVWKSDGSLGAGPGIYGQRLDPLGRRVGAEFRVNTGTNTVGSARVAMDLNANFVIAWSTALTPTGFASVARRFTWDGINNLPQFTVNDAADVDTEKFVTGVAMTPDGRFAIGWHTFNGLTSVFRAYLRFYDPAGAPVQGPIWIENANGADTVVPVANPADGYAVTYIRNSTPDSREIFLRTYDPAGTEKVGPFLVDTVNGGIQENATSAFAPDNTLFVVWESREIEDAPGIDDIYLQVMNVTTGAKIGPSARLNKITADNQSESSIAFAPNGDFFLTYRSDNLDFDGKGVAFTRIVPSQLPTLPDETFLNPFTQGNQSPSGDPDGLVGQNIATDGFGNYIAVWTSENQDGSGAGVYATKVFTSTAPYAETNDATDITSFSATLNGRVITHDSTVEVSFELAENLLDLGTANAIVIEATPSQLPPSDDPQSVSAVATGLVLGPNGTDKAYFYRTKVTAGSNIFYGEPALFATFNIGPVAVSDTFFVPGNSVTFQPQLNDSDIDQTSDTLTVNIEVSLDESIGTLTANGNALTFTAGSGFTERATFTYRAIDQFGQQSDIATVTLIRFSAVAGRYEGLVDGSAGTGSLSLTVNRKAGEFTGALLFNGIRTPLIGKFEPDGEIVMPVNGTAFSFRFRISDQGEVTGELRDEFDAVVGSLILDVINGGGAPNAVESGQYTTFLEVPDEGPAEAFVSGFAPRGGALESIRPGGFGFFLATVTKNTLNGRFVGALPDGTKTSAGSGLSKRKRYVISKQLYKKGKRFGGAVVGQPSFGSSTNRFSANLSWTKDPRPADVFFPQGFSNIQILVAAIKFVKAGQPITFEQSLNPNAQLNFSRGGFLDNPFVSLRISSQNRSSIQTDTASLRPKLSIQRFSPFFRGSFIHPGTNNRVKFSGIFKQKQLPSDDSEGRAVFRTKVPDDQGGTRGVSGRIRLNPL